VDYALRDPRTGRALAGVTNPFYGPKIWFTDDLTGDWQQAEGVELPPGGSAALERIWVIAPAEKEGGCTPEAIPACSSRAMTTARAGSSTRRCGTTRPALSGSPGGGGLCLHSIVPWPGTPIG